MVYSVTIVFWRRLGVRTWFTTSETAILAQGFAASIAYIATEHVPFGDVLSHHLSVDYPPGSRNLSRNAGVSKIALFQPQA
jgi:hypothetical protein